MKKKGVIPIIIAVAASLFFILMIFILTFGIVRYYINKYSGALSPDSGGCASTGAATCPSGTLSEFAKKSNYLKEINDHLDIYKRVGQKKNVPWEVLVGIHYRESNLDYNRSLCEGEAFNEECHAQGQVVAHNFEQSVEWAADHLQGKIGKQLKANEWNEDLIKRGIFGYNGASKGYKAQAVAKGFPREPGYDGSPYVMNNYDQRHTDYKLVKVDHGPMECCDKRDGAFTVASLLHNAEFGSDGKIVSIGGCNASKGGTSGSCAASIIPATGGITGPTACSQKIVDQVKKEVGSGDNSKYGNHEGGGWCAAFASWVYKSIGLLNVTDAAPVSLVSSHKKYLITIEINGRGGSHKGNISMIKPGDIYTSTYKSINKGGSGYHAGIVISVGSNGKITTIDGNVSHQVGVRERSINDIGWVARSVQCP